MYQKYQAHSEIMNMLKLHIQQNSQFTHNNKVYNLLIEDLDTTALTLNNNNDKIVIYLCYEDYNDITIDLSYMSKEFINNYQQLKNVDILESDNYFFVYQEKVICPTNDIETKQFISDLFNVFLVNILNNKYIKSVLISDTEYKTIF